ncbi:hypothetical protein [Opitutus terrae]|uniref:Tetratricopeptide TPR_4 n=1 Tax=Opitutus terrae (strain DSM 11246 / JCM 15787 / PB90-1) TaxID=452637 RepID=B1ZT94_OPITP|nr:hypothetical protein [Opitutus terrae]ACB76548.1 Tetratricopeptide TPR_4 [Opitutus terrae PB90-1]
MKFFGSKARLRRWIVALLALAVMLPVGYFAAREFALPAYRQWRESKLTRMTEEFMAKGDYDNALLTARQALRRNQRSLTHWRLAAEAAHAKNVPEVIYYQRNVVQLQPTLENQLQLLRWALQFGAYRDALDVIEHIDPAAKQNPEFHALAARTYLALGRPIAAKLNLYSLLSLRPDDHAARLNLAEIELAEDTEGKNSGVRQTITELSRVPELRLRALALLLQDAVQREDRSQAAALADQLNAEPNLSAEQRVLVLSGLDVGAPDRAAAYRQKVQDEFAGDPRAVVALANYYRRSGSPLEARRWFDSLPREVREDTGVQEAIAAAFLEWREWARLDQAISGTQWKEREFMRQAMIAYSARKNGRLADAGNAWRLAVIQAGDNVRSTSELLALVGRWGWQSEQYDLVWKLFALLPRNESISRQLIAWERAQGHTANLNRIFARLSEFSNEDPMVRNNFAYTSLLLNANLSKAYEYARLNYLAEPENPFYVTTQAFALYKQNKPADALALLESLRPAALTTPERLLFRALFHASTGDVTGATDLLSGLRSAGFLPEERKLLAETTSEIARLNGQRGQDQRLVALNTRGEIDRTKGWLHLLPELVQTSATMDMQTTDSLMAMGDLSGLAVQLRKGAWGDFEHLRMAVTAYAARQRGDASSARSYWRTALGAASGDVDKLRHLEKLAASWGWQGEKVDALARIFDIDPGNRAVFAELMDYNRSAGRTPELVSVLTAYLSAHPGDQAQRCGFAYYSLLSGLNIARAYVAAQEAYQAAPTDPQSRLVYAFSLWKQGRPQEAWEVLESLNGDELQLAPAALIRAAVLADMDRRDDAARFLKEFDTAKALPEEAKLALMVESKLKSDSRVSGMNY